MQAFNKDLINCVPVTRFKALVLQDAALVRCPVGEKLWPQPSIVRSLNSYLFTNSILDFQEKNLNLYRDLNHGSPDL